MKKLVLSIVCLVTLSIAAIPAGAQTRARINDRRYDHSPSRVYNNNQVYRNDVYRDSRNRNYDYYGDDRSVWDRSRDKITTGIGAGAGAIIGGLVGGTKGAIIGAAAGGGGAALYTYVLRDKDGYRH